MAWGGGPFAEELSLQTTSVPVVRGFLSNEEKENLFTSCEEKSKSRKEGTRGKELRQLFRFSASQ